MVCVACMVGVGGYYSSLSVRSGSRLCENSDLSIVRKNPTAQNSSQSTIDTSGDILQLPKTRAVGVFTQPRSIADVERPAIEPCRSPCVMNGRVSLFGQYWRS